MNLQLFLGINYEPHPVNGELDTLRLDQAKNALEIILASDCRAAVTIADVRALMWLADLLGQLQDIRARYQ